jgi:hypothetical protein
MRNWILVALLLAMWGVPGHAQSTDQFTPSDGTECAPYLAPIEPTCYYPITGKNSEGKPIWLVYNTGPGTLDIIDFPDGITETLEYRFTGLDVAVTTILSYTTPGNPAVYGDWQSKVTYQEFKGTFTGGTIDLIFKTEGQYKPYGRIPRTWVYTVTVVNEALDQNNKPVAGYGPSYVNY